GVLFAWRAVIRDANCRPGGRQFVGAAGSRRLSDCGVGSTPEMPGTAGRRSAERGNAPYLLPRHIKGMCDKSWKLVEPGATGLRSREYARNAGHRREAVGRINYLFCCIL
ncbi:MAG: hypothetical protein IJN25_05230, partial [Clostridia bacterium]|nr:hypothetical protein [Clostridia bacterium]